MTGREHRSRARRALPLIALTIALTAGLPAGSAWAGRLLVTGHDADLHCGGGTIDTSQCHYVAVAVGYARGGAPDPSKKVLLLDNNGLNADKTLTSLGIPHDTIDPGSPAFAATPINTATYSAMVVASDNSCGGCDLNGTPSATSQTPDSDAINARKADVAAFFNAGGGVLAFSGADHGDGNASNGADVYYSFIPVPVGGAAVAGPFSLTATGRALGFQDSTNRIGTHDDINCCATHNSFRNPSSGSPLAVAEKDGKGFAETIVGGGQISGGQLIGTAPPPPVFGHSVNVQVVRGLVYIKVPAHGGAHAAITKGAGFVPLTQARQVPVGSYLDTRRGEVKLASAANRRGRVQTAQFTNGIFQVLQNRRLKGLTDIRLSGGSFRSCARGAARGAAYSALSRRVIRRLLGHAHGRFRTRGRFSAATVRGTIWSTLDRCDGTLTRVRRGVVIVRDFRAHRNITVRTGKSVLVR